MKSIIELLQLLDKAKQEYDAKVSDLRKQVIDIQDKCPHPKELVSVTYHDVYDHAGPSVYEYTDVTATCLLCTKTAQFRIDTKVGEKVSLDYMLAKLR